MNYTKEEVLNWNTHKDKQQLSDMMIQMIYANSEISDIQIPKTNIQQKINLGNCLSLISGKSE